MFLAPFVLLVATVAGWRGERGWRWIVRLVAVWGLSAAVTYVAVWPAMWVAPVQSVIDVLQGAVGYAEDPHEGSNYFWGAIRPDPGPFFYPVSWFFRTTPLVLLGAAVSLARLFRRKGDGVERGVEDRVERRVERGALLTFVAFAVLFTLFMTTGAKKFDRYLLPVYPAVVLFASIGLAATVRWCAAAVGRRWNPALVARLTWPVAILAIGLLQAGLVLPHHPYDFSYYNPLAGGARTAQWALLVGWGEGLEQAVEHMNARADASELTVATRYRSAVGPILAGRALEMDDYDPASLDYYLLYSNQVQRDLDPDLIDRLYGVAEPELVASFKGIDYAWLYPNVNYVPVLAHIGSHALTGDAIAVRADSQLAKHDDGSLPLVTFDPNASANEILETLGEGLAQHDRLWYVRYDDVHPRPGLAAADFALATRAYALSETRFPEVSVRLLASDGPLDLAAPVQVDVQPLDASFGEDIGLSGYALASAPIEWGRDLGVHLDWQARGDLERDLTAFIHLLGPDGERWAQVDQRITDPDLVPTSLWPADTSARAVYHLGVPPGTPLGRYELHIGVYDSSTGERLPAKLDGASTDGDVVRLPVVVAQSPYEPDIEDLGLKVTIGHRMGDLQLLGYSLGGPVEGGGQAPVYLFWRGQPPPDPSMSQTIRIMDATGAVVGERAELLPRSATTGVQRSAVQIPIDGRARAGPGTLSVTLAGEDGSFVAVPGNGIELPLDIDGPVRRFEPPADAGEPVGANLGDVVTLLAYEMGGDRVSPGASVSLTVTWLAETLMDVPYTVFVHLLDEDGQLRGQIDAQPLAGRRPTTSWLPGEVLLDPYDVPVPLDAPSGRYRLAVGMYDPDTVTPLAATDSNGVRQQDDRVMLGTAVVR